MLLSLLVMLVSLHVRRGSDKRSQAVAILNDLLIAFDKLNELGNIPDIFCEANDLIRLPPVSSDTCTELVMRNHASLAEIEKQMRSLSESTASLSSKISVIDTQLSSLPSGTPSGSSTLTPSDKPITNIYACSYLSLQSDKE